MNWKEGIRPESSKLLNRGINPAGNGSRNSCLTFPDIGCCHSRETLAVALVSPSTNTPASQLWICFLHTGDTLSLISSPGSATAGSFCELKVSSARLAEAWPSARSRQNMMLSATAAQALLYTFSRFLGKTLDKRGKTSDATRISYP
jgi:hypothetical protein